MRAAPGFGLSLLALALTFTTPTLGQSALSNMDAPQAEDHAAAAIPGEGRPALPATIDTGAPPEVLAPGVPRESLPPASPLAAAIRAVLEAPAPGATERDTEERAAIAAFYAARGGDPLWFTADGHLNARGDSLIAEFSKSADWGLDPADFSAPNAANGTGNAVAETEAALTITAIKYARYARGGRIMQPAQQLSSYLDRAPQLQDPKETLASLAATDDAGAVLRDLHPKHPQFEKLRQKYLSLRGEPKANRKGNPFRALSSDAKRVLANMEEWRWMPIDMGDLYVWNNIPEYQLRVFKDGEMIHTERIVAGLVSKQTPIFSRPMRRIVFRPKWKIPESIKIREILPSLRASGTGGVMAQFGLRIETKDGQPVPVSSVNWATADIRNYEVVQPPGRHSILGNLKFSFPNPHTVYMHDTQDKYLFAATQRTYSHGCMRVRNPAKLAEVLLNADKGWDAAKIADLIDNGPLDNTVELEHRVPVHITYFTAAVDDKGKLVTFRDPYGHERRITQALEGRWNEIVKGRDHLAPVDPSEANVASAARATRTAAREARVQAAKPFNFADALFGGF